MAGMNLAFISGSACLSPLDTFGKTVFPESPPATHGTWYAAREPDYRKCIDAMHVRRMGRVVKMGAATAMAAMKSARLAMPDAILVGTGLGCFEDSDRFLQALITQHEGLLAPTHFIQSTHNAIASQIAMLLGCHGYNMTYTHQGASFECALADALMLLDIQPEYQVLVGAADEVTPRYRQLLAEARCLKAEITPEPPHAGQAEGFVPGEGSAFFCLTGTARYGCQARLAGVESFPCTSDSEKLGERLQHFLARHGLSVGDAGLILLGLSGDGKLDDTLHRLAQGPLRESPLAAYKHLCGEYFTASAFAMWMAVTALNTGVLPAAAVLNRPAGKPRHVVIVNQYRYFQQSFMLIAGC
jgi:3-oxoacyl-(acyl-carrier-protein) synthase